MTKTIVPLPTQLVTVKQAAEAAGMHHSSIRRRVDDGTLKAYRLGPKALRIDRDSLLAWLSTPAV